MTLKKVFGWIGIIILGFLMLALTLDQIGKLTKVNPLAEPSFFSGFILGYFLLMVLFGWLIYLIYRKMFKRIG